MLWLKANVSSALLQLITNDTIDEMDHQRRRDAIDRVIATVHAQRAILTIAYFGAISDIASYITAANTTPKFVITEGCNGPVGGGAMVANKFSSNIFYIAVGYLSRNPMWQRMNDVLTDIQNRVRGLFVVPRHVMRRQIQPEQAGDHFDWCWRNGFIDAMVLVDDEMGSDKRKPFTVYGYERFPKLSVRKMPVHRVWFSDKLKNFQGTGIRTTYQFDPPRVFRLLEPWPQNNWRIIGYAADMLQAFLKIHNATLQLVVLNNSSRYDIISIIEHLRHGDLDISMNPYYHYKDVRLSYPISMLEFVAVLPSSGEIERFRYFVRPFQTHTWFCFLLALFYLSFMRRLTDRISAYWYRHARPSFGRGCLEVWRLLLFLPINVTRDRICFQWHNAITLLLTALLGFILTNLYQASLTSFLAKSVFRPQLDTLTELVEQNVSLNINANEVDVILNSSSLPRNFRHLFLPRDATELRDELLVLKRHAYAACLDIANFVLGQQAHMQRKPLYRCKEVITTLPFGFLLPNRSPYEHIVNRFILRAEAAGLTVRWKQNSNDDGFRTHLLYNRNEMLRLKRPLNLEYFQFAWIVLSMGLLAALFGFALEIMQHWMQQRRRCMVRYCLRCILKFLEKV